MAQPATPTRRLPAVSEDAPDSPAAGEDPMERAFKILVVGDIGVGTRSVFRASVYLTNYRQAKPPSSSDTATMSFPPPIERP